MTPIGWFKKDWGAVLAKAESVLSEGDPVHALELALKAARKVDADLAPRARELVTRARAAVVDSVIAKADAAEAEGDWEDAADWLSAAVEQVGDEWRARELEARREALLARADEERSPFVADPDIAMEGQADEGLEEAHYEALVEMLRADVRPGWSGRPEAFRRAVVELNEGRAAEALAVFDELAASEGEDAALRFERGRARLATGDTGGAVEDLEAAWESLGDEPLEASGALSAPALWAEAAMEIRGAEEVARRLEPLAEPERGGPEVCLAYAAALLSTGRVDEARSHLESVGRRLPKDPRFPRLLAAVLTQAGEAPRAIALLEAAIAPSCAGGSCGRPPKDLATLRALAALHLGGDGEPDRARELLALVAQERRGRLAAPDYDLLARYYEAAGDEAAAGEARAEAERLQSTGELESAPPPALATSGRVL